MFPVLFRHNKTPKVFCLTFGVHVKDVRDLFHNKPWWILFGAGVATLVFNSIRDGAAVYYFKYFVVEE